MMAPIIRGVSVATCTTPILFLAKLLKAPIELKAVDMHNGEHKTAKHLELQPWGKIPVLTDDDLTIFESRAIMRYLMSKYQNEALELYPKDIKKAALVEQFISCEQSYFSPAVFPLVREVFFGPKFLGKTSDPAKVKEILDAVDDVLAKYDKLIGSKNFLVGDSITLADVFHIAYMYYAVNCGAKDTFYKYPNVKRWTENLLNTPEFKEIEKENFPTGFF